MSSQASPGYQGRILKGAALAATPQAAPTPAPTPAEQAEFEARRLSDNILREARQQADQIVQDAHNHAAYIGEQAQHEADQTLARRLLTLTRSFRNEVEEVQPRLVAIVTDAVSDIIGLVPDHELVDRLLVTALKDIDRRAAATIFTSPHDYQAAHDLVQRMRADGDAQVEFVEVDQHLNKGVFRIEANGVSTEVGVDAQLAVLERILAGAEADPAHHVSNE